VPECSHPIRLRGWHERIDEMTGELLARVVTAREPGGVILVACGDRRTAVCPSCAETYRHDAFHLVASGLRGGKGVPESVSSNPSVMVTLTAPSFGRVHTIRDKDGSCPCGAMHSPEDEVLGAAVDLRTYRYRDQAMWNHLAPILWKRTVQEIRRQIAHALGVPRHRLAGIVRVRFVKASEFQRRGVVHYHAIVRLDGSDGPGSAPPPACSLELLEQIIRDSVRSVAVHVTRSDGSVESQRPVRWGREAEIMPLDLAEVGRASGYIAKYATKATEVAADGLLIPRVHGPRDIAALDAPEHARRLVEAAWRIGGLQGLGGARRWAHQFGYGGHTLTKSHDYSVTFGALREARTAWRAGQPAEEPRAVIRRGRLVYAGRAQPLATSLMDVAGRNLPETGGRGS
jgi:hypothetical protein